MSYTEKVSLSGTALSFLLYECVNSVTSQEGFLIGDVTSQITNHISDSQNDNTRLDTHIVIKTALPLPSVSLFYLPTGRIKEDALKDLLSNTTSEIVGWYKYRKNSSIRPTFRDKLISKGLQKYFEKYHGKKMFVTCILSNKTSSSGSTHAFTYRFGKINCFDMYEYIEDVTANLGEKVTGYKTGHKLSPQSIFNKIVNECNVRGNNTSDAILHIQEAVNVRLMKEAKLSAKNESAIRELEAEINEMNGILYDKHTLDLQATYDKIMEEKSMNTKTEMVEAYVKAYKTPMETDVHSVSNILVNSNSQVDNERSVKNIANDSVEQTSSLNKLSSMKKPPVLNYAAALKNKNEVASTSKSSNFTEDLIVFDVGDKQVKKPVVAKDNDVKCIEDSSPEY